MKLITNTFLTHKPGDIATVFSGINPNVWLDVPQPIIIIGPATYEDYKVMCEEAGIIINEMSLEPNFYFFTTD